MADLDRELLDRAVQWCAEAGRQVVAAEVRRALAPLGWDELLAVRALLADPPPARPLGPQALADLARGAPPDVAAEREREGRYRDEGSGTDEDEPLPEAVAAPARPSAPPARRRRRGPGVVIRRARDRVAAPVEPPAPRPDVAELRRPEGRAVLEQLVRRHGARRAPILAALAVGWTSHDGAAPGDAELSALLDHHGLAHAFERRERDELLHALRAAGGVRAAAAASLGLDAEGLAAALDRLDATAQAERIREGRRAELRARATLAERVRLLLSDEPRLRDLGLVEEFEADLRVRLPEHVRALASGGDPIAIALSRSLAIARPDADAVAARFGLSLPAAAAAKPPGRRPGRPPATKRQGPRAQPFPRAGRSGPGPRRSGGPRPGSGPRPAGERRPASGPRPAGGPRPVGGPRPAGERRPASGPRPAGERRPASGPRGSRPASGGRAPGGKPARGSGSAPRRGAPGGGRPPRR